MHTASITTNAGSVNATDSGGALELDIQTKPGWRLARDDPASGQVTLRWTKGSGNSIVELSITSTSSGISHSVRSSTRA